MEVFPNAPPLHTVFGPTALSSPGTLSTPYHSTCCTLLRLCVECFSSLLLYKLCEGRDHFSLVLGCSAQQGVWNMVGTQ